MNIQQVHERFDSWNYNTLSEKIDLVDHNNAVVTSLDVNYLIELWFNKQDE